VGGSSQDRSSTTGSLEEIDSLDAPVELVRRRRGLYVRWLRGPEEDGEERSCDHASGLELPRLAVSPWTRPGGGRCRRMHGSPGR
jgi:hypothetical protein